MQHNCYDCDFQGGNRVQLAKHIRLKHGRIEETKDISIQCKYCGKQYTNKKNFMSHRKIEHPGVVAHCKNNAVGECYFSAETCWWSHTVALDEQPTSSIECFVCGKSFKTRNEMMMHRKQVHSKVVRQCEMFKLQTCRYKSDACWFVHEKDVQNINKAENVGEDEDDFNLKSVFQKTTSDLKPPLENSKKKQKME